MDYETYEMRFWLQVGLICFSLVIVGQIDNLNGLSNEATMSSILNLPILLQVQIVLESVLPWNPQSPDFIERRGDDAEKRSKSRG